MQHYQLAADYFRGEESNSAANKCLVKVAQYAAQLDNFEKGKLTLSDTHFFTSVF
jgi:alpha-soluble NSF attachment protein